MNNIYIIYYSLGTIFNTFQSTAISQELYAYSFLLRSVFVDSESEGQSYY